MSSSTAMQHETSSAAAWMEAWTRPQAGMHGGMDGHTNAGRVRIVGYEAVCGQQVAERRRLKRTNLNTTCTIRRTPDGDTVTIIQVVKSVVAVFQGVYK